MYLLSQCPRHISRDPFRGQPAYHSRVRVPDVEQALRDAVLFRLEVLDAEVREAVPAVPRRRVSHLVNGRVITSD